MRPAVITGSIVARRGAKQNSRVTGGPDRILESLRVCRRTPAGVYHADIHAFAFPFDRVIDRFDGIFSGAETAASQKFKRHDLDFPVDAGDTFIIIAFGADNTGAMGTV